MLDWVYLIMLCRNESNSWRIMQVSQLIAQCRFCGGTDRLVRICDCYPGLNEAHIDCLTQHVILSQNDRCMSCERRFKGIIVKFTGNGFCLWIRRDPTARFDVIVLPIAGLFFLFIAYLGYIHYITTYWYHPFVLRFIFNHMCTIIFLASLFSLIGIVFKSAYSFLHWRRENTRITVVPVPQELLALTSHS